MEAFCKESQEGRETKMGIIEDYQKKCVPASEAVKIIKDGDNVDYGSFNGKPVVCDVALSERSEELSDIKIFSTVTLPPVPEVVKHPGSFTYHDMHFTKISRVLQRDFNIGYYVPVMYHQVADWFENSIIDKRNAAICAVCPMDEHGYFNLGPQNSATLADMEAADKVIVEVNPNMPVCLGGAEESIHISKVDFVVEAPADQKLPDLPVPEASEADRKIAENLMDYITDGSCIQLGIGGLPNAVGKIIAESDLKDLGGHTEMLADAYVDMIESGRMTGVRKSIDKNRVPYTFAMGSQRLYDFMNNNPAVASYPASYTNDPKLIAQLDKFISINNAVQVDLYTQVNGESNGFNQISGNGGMLDFVLGAQWSKQGKSFICLASTFTDSSGTVRSRIVPTFSPGSITTIPRQMVDYIATEFGVVQLRGRSTWDRTERLISIAHPDFQDELIKEAEAMKIWRHSNKKVA